MASYGYSLAEFLKKEKPKNIDEILTFALTDRMSLVPKILSSPIEEKQYFCFECGIINQIQAYLTKKNLPPVYFDTQIEKYTIQQIIIKRYQGNYVIKLEVDRWLGDTIDHVCEYVEQVYDINYDTLQVTYRNSSKYRH